MLGYQFECVRCLSNGCSVLHAGSRSHDGGDLLQASLNRRIKSLPSLSTVRAFGGDQGVPQQCEAAQSCLRAIDSQPQRLEGTQSERWHRTFPELCPTSQMIESHRELGESMRAARRITS